MNCQNCNKQLTQSQIKEKGKYCSKSCATKINNSLFKKRSLKQIFCLCGAQIFRSDHSVRRKLCDSCQQAKSILNQTYEVATGRYNYQKNSKIRAKARSIFYKTNPDPKCAICGYDKHIEVCHIKAISSYNNDTLVSEINDIKNLIGLCPNHHWELDNGLLALSNLD